MKSRVKNVINYLNRKFPFANAEAWDKVGHQFGDDELKFNKAVIALDLTNDVFNLAVKTKAQLIVVHHPFLFEKTIAEDIAKAPYKADLIARLENTGINVVVLHTNYDLARDGMTMQVLKKLALDKKIITRHEYGALIELNKTYGELENIFNKNHIPFVQTNFTKDEQIETLAIIPGAADAETMLSYREADLIVTCDIKWANWVMANEEKLKLVEVPHYIEEVFVNHISNMLKKNFKATSLEKHFVK